jgi:hypothetical protein
VQGCGPISSLEAPVVNDESMRTDDRAACAWLLGVFASKCKVGVMNVFFSRKLTRSQNVQ